MIQKIKVLIIGLGNIAYKYDLFLENNYILTHVRAFQHHTGFEIIGVVDFDKKALNSFSEYFNYNLFSSVEEASKKLCPDLFVISTPPNTHFNITNKIFEYFKPKYIICEKPLGNNLNSSKSIIQICKNNGCQLFINYQRNSSITSSIILEKILNNEFKPPFKAVIWYSKGLLNTASHFITLFNLFFGKFQNIQVLNSKFSEFCFKLDYQNCEAIFIPVSSDFFFNEFEMVFKNGKLLYKNGGETAYWYPVDKKRKSYSQYNILSNKPEPIVSDFYSSQLSFVENIWKYILGEKSSICLPDNILDTIEIINFLKVKSNGI